MIASPKMDWAAHHGAHGRSRALGEAKGEGGHPGGDGRDGGAQGGRRVEQARAVQVDGQAGGRRPGGDRVHVCEG